MIDQRYYSTGANETRYKIIMVGDSCVGKTTIFWRYLEGQFLTEKESNVTTIDFKIKEIKIDEKNIKLYLWDTAGQQKYRSIVATYFKGCDGVMLVFDLSKTESFRNLTSRWYDIAKSKSPDAEMIVIGNKSDLNIAVNEQQVQSWCKQQNVTYIKTSVKLNINVDQCFNSISKKIYERQHKPVKAESFSLKKHHKEQTKKGCC